MAAESATHFQSLDRLLCVRHLVETLFHGEPELRDREWRIGLQIPGMLVTDAKSFYHNQQNDAFTPAARQTPIDVRYKGPRRAEIHAR